MIVWVLGLSCAVFMFGLAVLGLSATVAKLDERLTRIEDADAEAEKVIDVWYAQAPTTVTDKGLES